jgi:hypothetical protein
MRRRLPLDIKLDVEIQRQPDETTCGPTCLDAVYQFYDDQLPLADLVDQCQRLDHGGTFAAYLGCHALDRGYTATLYTWDLKVFDPSWFKPGSRPLLERLAAQLKLKSDASVRTASAAYSEFLQRGGMVRLRDLTAPFIRGLIRRGVPVVAGLSSTYLYRTPREFGPNDVPDDLRGEPAGHFVVLSGYRRRDRVVRVSDPYLPNPVSKRPHYWVNINRLICAVLLGNLTFDANLLVITPNDRASAR